MEQNEFMDKMANQISETTTAVDKAGTILIADILDMEPETKMYDGKPTTRYLLTIKDKPNKVKCPYSVMKQVKTLMKTEKLLSFRVVADGEGLQKRYTVIPEVAPK